MKSEEQRKRGTEDIKRWCDHVRATPLSRPYDIPSLVDTILGEFYRVTFCCGHLGDMDDGITIEFYEYNDKSKGTVKGIYCKYCAERYKKEIGAWEIKDG